MKSSAPIPFEGAAELRRMLRELGQAETNPPRGAEAEATREERMATSIDAELSRLVSARSRVRRLGTLVLAAAAVVALGIGVRRFVPGASSLAISQEPLAVKVLKQQPSAVAAPVLPEPLFSAVKRAPLPPRASAASSAAASVPVASAAPPQSTLAEENLWFKEAAEASRNGDVNGALGKLEQLLREHPQSPLAQTALVRKFRLLAKAGRTEESRREAERYLSTYPTGFAVNEALGIERGAEPSAGPGAEEHTEP
ncbi:MAG TPA: hypothetical protein VHB79_17625 [Polyangiaceae bacterium]|nr:hypothetical protein [Polyangiaceae bacterium]